MSAAPRALAFGLAALLAPLPALADTAARESLHLAKVLVDQAHVDAGGGAVELYARVLTATGEPAVGLDPANTVVLEDGAPVDPDRIEIATLGAAQRGVAWVLVLDTSPTMQDVVPAMKEAARKFVDRADDWDAVAVVTLGADVEVAAPFTADRAALRQAIDAVQASQTPIPARRNDAVDEAIGLIRAVDSPRRGVVVVFSDGSEDDSTQAAETIAAHAAGEENQGQILVYTIGYETGFGDAGLSEMDRLSRATTAEHWQASRGTSVEDFYAQIWTHVYDSYVVRFETDLDGLPHAVRLVVAGKDATRAVLYPRASRGVPTILLLGLALAAVVGGAVAVLRVRRTGKLLYKSGPERGRAVRLKRGVNRIGQAADNEVVIPHDTVSRRHAEVEVSGGQATLRDLDSTNGTFVNEVAVESARILQSGDRVRIADVDLEYVR